MSSRETSPTPAQPTRRDALGWIAGGLAGVSAAGAVSYLVVQAERARTAKEQGFLESLRVEPLRGEIAYACGAQVKVLPGRCVPDAITAVTKVFQVPQDPKAMAWLSKSEILILARSHDRNPGGTPHDPSKRFNMTYVSDGLFKLDVVTGKTAVLFDPYSAAATEIFGNISERDGTQERTHEEEFNSNDGRSRIIIGRFAALQIESIGTAPGSECAYFKTGGRWYQVEKDSRSLRACEVIPTNLRTDHGDTGERGITLEEKGGLLEKYRVVVKTKEVTGVELEDGSRAGAYRAEQ